MTARLPIDLRFKHVGRIKGRWTRDAKVNNRLKRMLKSLEDMGRTDLLVAIRDRQLDALDVLRRFDTSDLNRLPSAELFDPLETAWQRWIDKSEFAADYKIDLARTLARLVEVGGAKATIPDLPRLIERMRDADQGVRPRRWNMAHDHARSFVRSRVGRFHWLYQDVAKFERLKVTAKAIHPQTVEQVRARAEKLSPEHARILWALCLTGMRPPSEFWEVGAARWAVEADRVKIVGTKREASIRVVPKVGLILKPTRGPKAFQRALKESGKTPMTPYDCRRTYANWLVLANIPANRRDAYLGHGPKNMRDLYERPGDLAAWLAEDAAAIGQLVGAETTALRMVR